MLEDNAKTLVNVLESRALNQSDRLSYNFIKTGKEHKLTYAQLDRKARAIAAYLTKLDLKGQRALLLYPQGLDFIEAFIGCLYAGVIAVPLHPPATEAMAEKISHVASNCQPKIILSNKDVIKKMKVLNIANKIKQVPVFGKLFKLQSSNITDINHIPWIASDNINLSLATSFSGTQINQEDIAFLQYTSGSTSMPKGVMVTHENIMSNEKMISKAFGLNNNDTVVSWLPLSHDMGLIGSTLQPLYKGFPVIFSDPIDFIKDPFLWLNMISKYKASCTGAPNFGYDHCVNRISDQQKELLDLSSWRLAFNGAEPIKLKTLDRFYEAFKDCGFKKSAFDPVYGLAESTLFVTGSDLKKLCKTKEVDRKQLAKNIIKKPISDQNKVILVSSGHSYLDNEISIVNVNTMQKCPKNIVGEIWIKSKSNAKGYWNNKEATQETFEARLENGEGPYLRTGDLGFLDEDEDLFVTGRLKDLIIIRGENHYPQDIEQSVELAHNAIRKGCVASFSTEDNGIDKLIVVAEVKPTILKRSSPEEVILDISKVISAQHQVHLDDVVLIEPRSINKTTSGKIQRHKVKHLYLDKKLKEIYHGDVIKVHSSNVKKHFVVANDEIEQTLSSIWRQVLSLESISVDEDFAELGGDSLAFMQAAMLIEQEFAIPIEIEQIYNNSNIIKLAKYITKNSKKKSLFSKKDHSISAPLAPMQEWFFEQDFKHANHWNVAIKFDVDPDVNLHYLEKSLNILVHHHDILRTRFRNTDDGIIQQVEAKETNQIFEKHTIKKGKNEQELMDKIELIAQKSMDYQNGPIVKMVYFDLGNDQGRVLLITHHLICDMLSANILLTQLEKLYQCLKEGKNTYLPPVEKTFLDYCNIISQYAKGKTIVNQLNYWKEQLLTKTPDFKTDYKNQHSTKGQSDYILLKYNKKETQKLTNLLNKEYNANIIDAICSATYKTLSHYLNTNEVPIRFYSHGRTNLANFKEAEKTIGWMSYRFPIKLKNNLNETKKNIIKNTKEAFKKVPLNGIGYGLLRFANKYTSKELSKFDEYPVTINHYGQISYLTKEYKGALRCSPVEFSKYSFAPEGKRNDILGIYSVIYNDELSIKFNYGTNCLKKETVQEIVSGFDDFIKSL